MGPPPGAARGEGHQDRPHLPGEGREKSCTGRDEVFCSQTDPSTWCCNLEVYDGICAADGTYAQITRLCNAETHGGINCANCPESAVSCRRRRAPLMGY